MDNESTSHLIGPIDESIDCLINLENNQSLSINQSTEASETINQFHSIKKHETFI